VLQYQQNLTHFTLICLLRVLHQSSTSPECQEDCEWQMSRLLEEIMRLNEAAVIRVILVIVGAFIVFVGINTGFGGIQTLGWQIPPGFASITNEAVYLVQDNHTRFLAGLFGAVGLFMLLGATNLQRYQAELRLVFVIIFLGGLARFTSLQLNVIFGANVVISLVAEVILMPILFFWLPRVLNYHQEPIKTT
jgi:hypothetical protein